MWGTTGRRTSKGGVTSGGRGGGGPRVFSAPHGAPSTTFLSGKKTSGDPLFSYSCKSYFLQQGTEQGMFFL